MMLKIFYTLIGVLLVFFLLGFSSLSRRCQRISGVRILLDTTTPGRFVSRAKIARILRGDGVVPNRPLRTVDLGKVEAQIDSLPYVADAQAFVSIDGKVEVDLKQEKALARVRSPQGDYYLSDAAEKMPLCRDYSADVILAQGEFEQDDLRDLKALVKALQQRPFLSEFIIGVSLEKPDYILDTRGGAHRVIFGKAARIGEKLDKLTTFYKKVLNVEGWNTCQLVNLKYRDQVICTKS